MEGGAPLRLFAWGPVAVAALLMISAFVALEAYRAWRMGERFRLPTRDFIAILVIVCFLGAVLYELAGGADAEKSLDLLLGALIAAASAIVAFYFNQPPPEDKP
ncbi:MAG TPA: hypothetical protein VGG68_15590 [Caulobacteraceae bacterium]|jgi:peptidoglycan/LPS O-acetylase OafA/YrhL